jgi:hypothetical protein
VPVAPASFGDFLRHLPLEPAGTRVHQFDGSEKRRQDVHAAVVALDVGPPRDLQQCADAVMRLWAEYLFAAGRYDAIRFHPDPGRPRVLAWRGGADRRGWLRYLTRVFADAGTASLAAELSTSRAPLDPGDVLIQPGYPGHAILVLDAVVDGAGRRQVLLGQSYMPAQQFHVLRVPGGGGAWFDAAAVDSPAGLATPEWRPFHRSDVRRFPALGAPQ